MATITIRKTMYAHYAMFKAYGDFLWRKSFIFYPKQGIFTKHFELHRNLMFVYSYVFIGFSKLTCPIPYVTIHTFMQITNKLFREYLFRFKFFTKYPL